MARIDRPSRLLLSPAAHASELAHGGVAALTDLGLQELREAYRRALRDGREDELYYVDCEINFRKSVNDFR